MRILAAALLASTLAAGCSEPAPAAIVYDSDACDHCRMTIAAPAFAAQLVRTGNGATSLMIPRASPRLRHPDAWRLRTSTPSG